VKNEPSSPIQIRRIRRSAVIRRLFNLFQFLHALENTIELPTMLLHKLKINHKVSESLKWSSHVVWKVKNDKFFFEMSQESGEQKQRKREEHKEFISSSLKWHFNDVVHQSALMAG
jgi:ABC-type histidine transport system ATPase subunit